MQPSNTFNPYPQPGDVLDGKYRIERMLGEGGMGAVAKATHLIRRAPVALKFMSGAVLSLPGAVERFVNEGVAASQIDSDHVVRVLDVGRLPSGAPYLVMEFLDGRDLSEVLASEGPCLSVPRAVHFTIQILRALHTAHNAGIVHRDMKPSNCFVISKDGEPDFVKLVDFGISKVTTADDGAVGANLTRTNSALGTPLYMSPEQARSPRDVDHRTDLYSVGAILYEMLCGRTPYTSETGEFTEILFKIFTTEPPPLASMSPGVPAPLAGLVHRALCRHPDGRFGSALEMAEALVPFGDTRSSGLFAKLRTAGGRSILPAAPSGSPAASSAALAAAADAGIERGLVQASTLGARETESGGGKVATDIGVTRDTPALARGSRRIARLGATGAAIVVAGVIGAVAMRAPSRESAHGSGVPSAGDAPSTGRAGGGATGAGANAATAAPVVPVAPIPCATPDAIILAPLPSSADSPRPSLPAVASASARPAAPGGTKNNAIGTPASSPSVLPKQLSDLKLH